MLGTVRPSVSPSLCIEYSSAVVWLQVVRMWVDHLLFICQLSVGSLLRIVCTAVLGKMASAQVFAFSLFLILTVHGSEVGKLV